MTANVNVLKHENNSSSSRKGTMSENHDVTSTRDLVCALKLLGHRVFFKHMKEQYNRSWSLCLMAPSHETSKVRFLFFI